MSHIDLVGHDKLKVTQRFEVGELFGFETRNKYQILDESGSCIGFIAEQSKGILGFLLRQILGHWRKFDIHVFNNERKLVFFAKQPFRFIFQRLELYDANKKYLGAIQQRFSILTKRFDIEDSRGRIIFETSSPFYKIWTFPIKKFGVVVSTIKKSWSGVLTEFITDKDSFMIDFTSEDRRNHETLNQQERELILAAAIYIDLRYFENKAD